MTNYRYPFRWCYNSVFYVYLYLKIYNVRPLELVKKYYIKIDISLDKDKYILQKLIDHKLHLSDFDSKIIRFTGVISL
jgi:hypothetical protein